jgi:iron(III) transport system ATP-binding protein
MAAEFLKISGVTKKYGDFAALRDIELDVAEGEFLCLLGPSGCGKTTLLRIIAGLENATAGTVHLRGADITSLHPSRRNFGIVFQSYALFPNMTIRQNITFGLKNRKLPKEQIREITDEALTLVNMTEQSEKYPSQLSGGQQQRVALARALALKPDFLLLDEPLSALDAKVRQKVRKEIKLLQRRLGITTIMVTHDQEEALTMADRIVVMNNACIRQTGTPQEVYNAPNSPFVADFVGTINFFVNSDLSAQGDEMSEKLQDNHYKLKAIRPEHVSIADGDSGLVASVHDIEFQGASYRVTLALTGGNEEIFGSEHVSMDVAALEYQKLGIAVGDTVRVRLGEDNMLFYRLDLDPQFVYKSGDEL